MLKIGVTGLIGSGKTTVCQVFEVFGIPVFYADTQAREIMFDPAVIRQVREAFGRSVIDKDDHIDRKSLANIVFNDPERLSELNAIVHPRVHQAFKAWLTQQRSPYVLMESAILFQTGFASYMDRCIVVVAPEEVRIERVQNRDGVSRKEVLARMKNQLSQNELIEKADYLIQNDGMQLIIPQSIKIDMMIRE